MPTGWEPLANFGFAAVVLGWVLLRVETRLERAERAVDRMTRALMLDLAARGDTPLSIKEQALGIVREIDSKTGQR